MVLVLAFWKPCVLNADAKTERVEKILYPSVPMGQENYYVYKDSTNSDISAENLSSLNGNRIGVTKNSIQTGIFRDWADMRGITTELIELDISDNDSIKRADELMYENKRIWKEANTGK